MVSCDYLVAGEIFIRYAGEQFPFLFGREGTLDSKGTYLSMFYGDTEMEEQSLPKIDICAV